MQISGVGASVLFVGLLASCLGWRHTPPHQTAEACRVPWRITTLPPIRDSAILPTTALFEPSATRFGSQLLIAGNLTTVWDDGRNGVQTVLRDSAGNLLPIPEDARDGVRPVIVATGSALHLLWGELAGPLSLSPDDNRPAWPPRLRSVWLSTRVASGAWSRPRLVVKAPETNEVSWGGLNGDLAQAPDSSVHLALFDGALGIGRAKLVHVRLSGSGAEISEQPWRRSGYNATLAWDGRSGVMGFITAAPLAAGGSRYDVNSVFVSRFDADSGRWLSEQLVSRSGSVSASRTQLIVTNDGTFHLVWGQSLDDGLTAEVLRHAQSSDGGLTWSPPQDVPAYGAYPMAIARLGSRGFGVVYLGGWETEMPRLMLACWDEAWSAGRPLLDDVHVYNPRPISGTPKIYIALWQIPSLRQYKTLLVSMP